jgi:hypothetical protein
VTARYPWAQFDSPLDLTIAEVRVGDEVAAVVYDSVQRVHLDQLEEGWRDIELDVELSTNEFLPAQLEDADLRAHAVLSSSVTNARIPIKLESTGDDAWSGVLRVNRAELGGVMSLEAYVTARDGQNRPLLRGTSTSWTIVVDPGQSPSAPTQVPVVSRWVDFASTDAPAMCRTYSTAPYAVLMEESKPVLYLNEGQQGFQKLLLNVGAREERRRLRDITSTVVAAAVIRALLQASFDAVVTGSRDSDSPVSPEEPLFRQACEAVAGELASVSDVDELYQRMFDADQSSNAEVQTLWSELDLAITSLVSVGDMIVKAADELR